MKKKFEIMIMAVCISFVMFGFSQTVSAASGKTSVSVSSENVKIGESVTVTAKVSGASEEKAIATMTLSYDLSVLQFESCTASAYGGGGNSVTVTGDSFSVTLKAVSSGTAKISLSAADGVLFDDNEEMDSVLGSSVSVTVENAAVKPGAADGSAETAAPASGDNSLKSLTLSQGTLSPAFSMQTTKYTATVSKDVTNIAVTAEPTNSKATVESVSGNTNLAMGENTIKVVVKAENGVTAVYSIRVTRQDAAEQREEPEAEEKPASENTERKPASVEEIEVLGSTYIVTEDFKTEELPAGYVETTVNYHGVAYKGATSDSSALKLLCLVEKDAQDKKNKFFICDEVTGTLYPFVQLGSGENCVTALLPPADVTVPDTYQPIVFAVNDVGDAVNAYQESSGDDAQLSDFYVFYGVNQLGVRGWYSYDTLEKTWQRYTLKTTEEKEDVDNAYLQSEYLALSKKYAKEKVTARIVMAILTVLVVALAVVVINLIMQGRKKMTGRVKREFGDSKETRIGKPQTQRQTAPERKAVPERKAAPERSEKPERKAVSERKAVPERSEKPERKAESERKAVPERSEKPERKAVLEQKAVPERNAAAKQKKEKDLEIIDFNDL